MLFLILITIGFGSACLAEDVKLQPKQTFVTSIALEAPTSLSITNSGGDVEVEEVNDPQITLEATNEGSTETRVTFGEVSPGQFEIESQNLNSLFQNSRQSMSNVRAGGRIIVQNSVSIGEGPVHLKIRIPAAQLSHLKIKTSQGDVSVRGEFAGALSNARRLDLKTSQGQIQAQSVKALGGIEIKTSQGDVILNKMSGSIVARTSQGNITAGHNSGEMDAKTSQGNISISGQTSGAIRARSSIGNIELDNPGALSEDAKTNMGQVKRRSRPAGCAPHLDRETKEP